MGSPFFLGGGAAGRGGAGRVVRVGALRARSPPKAIVDGLSAGPPAHSSNRLTECTQSSRRRASSACKNFKSASNPSYWIMLPESSLTGRKTTVDHNVSNSPTRPSKTLLPQGVEHVVLHGAFAKEPVASNWRAPLARAALSSWRQCPSKRHHVLGVRSRPKAPATLTGPTMVELKTHRNAPLSPAACSSHTSRSSLATSPGKMQQRTSGTNLMGAEIHEELTARTRLVFVTFTLTAPPKMRSASASPTRAPCNVKRDLSLRKGCSNLTAAKEAAN